MSAVKAAQLLSTQKTGTALSRNCEELYRFVVSCKIAFPAKIKLSRKENLEQQYHDRNGNDTQY
ncbi:MAG: hypothetical protein UIB39_01475, partial [Lachnospiraceae bacterium]|nr:hypothetical protein [Lachnospiraceae bacterium]